MTVVVQKGDD